MALLPLGHFESLLFTLSPFGSMFWVHRLPRGGMRYRRLEKETSASQCSMLWRCCLLLTLSHYGSLWVTMSHFDSLWDALDPLASQRGRYRRLEKKPLNALALLLSSLLGHFDSIWVTLSLFFHFGPPLDHFGSLGFPGGTDIQTTRKRNSLSMLNALLLPSLVGHQLLLTSACHIINLPSYRCVECPQKHFRNNGRTQENTNDDNR